MEGPRKLYAVPKQETPDYIRLKRVNLTTVSTTRPTSFQLNLRFGYERTPVDDTRVTSPINAGLTPRELSARLRNMADYLDHQYPVAAVEPE